MAAIRLVPAGMLVLMVAWFSGRPQPKTLQAWLWIALFALMDGTLFQGFLALGLNRTGTGLGSVIIDSQPLAVALMSSWLFKEVIGVWGWLGLGLGIGGISLIGLPDQWFYDFFGQKAVNIDFSWQELLNSGEMLMLLASLSMAVGTVLIRFVCRHADPVSGHGMAHDFRRIAAIFSFRFHRIPSMAKYRFQWLVSFKLCHDFWKCESPTEYSFI
jgi:drug/metabolite transporter (DMT)-like permease